MRNSFGRVLGLTLVFGTLLVSPQPASAQQPASTAACNQPTAEPVVHVALPGNPFRAIATPDGCWIFVSMQGRPPLQSGVAGVAAVLGTIPVDSGPRDATLMKDGGTLFVPNFNSKTLQFVDLARARID